MKKLAVGKMNMALRYAREQKGWSQEQVADLLGTNAFTVYRWESGRAYPSPYYRQKLCELFQCEMADLGLFPITPSLPCHTGEAPFPFSAVAPFSEPPPLPVFRPCLLGRDNLLASLRAQLCTGQRPLSLALSGSSGVGKTALAIALASDPAIRHHFSDGILWASLGLAPNIRAILENWASIFGFAPAASATLRTVPRLSQELRVAICERKMLLIIDDVWHAEQALTFKLGGANTAYLFTTRSPLLAMQVAPEGAILVPELSSQGPLRAPFF